MEEFLGRIDGVWVFVNILLPILVPMFGVAQVRRRGLTPGQKKRVTAIATIRDGQLAWVSVLWTIGAVYEIVEFAHLRQIWHDWMTGMLFTEGILLVWGMRIAGNGAVTAGYNEDDWELLLGSIGVTTISAIVFVFVHTEVHLC